MSTTTTTRTRPETLVHVCLVHLHVDGETLSCTDAPLGIQNIHAILTQRGISCIFSTQEGVLQGDPDTLLHRMHSPSPEEFASMQKWYLLNKANTYTHIQGHSETRIEK